MVSSRIVRLQSCLVGKSVSGVGVLDKAVSILDALEARPMVLAELTATTGLSRATAHRLALALEHHGFLRRGESGRFELGPRMATSSHEQAARSALEDLRDATGERVQLYVPRHGQRLCLVSHESAYRPPTIVAVGALLRLARGAAGEVSRGDDGGRRRGCDQSVEEREKGVASVSAPIRRGDEIVGVVSVSGPVERTTRNPGRRYAEHVVAAARRIEDSLSTASGVHSLRIPQAM